MRQLYDRGVRGFLFTDAQFIPAGPLIDDAKQLLRGHRGGGNADIPLGRPHRLTTSTRN